MPIPVIEDDQAIGAARFWSGDPLADMDSCPNWLESRSPAVFSVI